MAKRFFIWLLGAGIATLLFWPCSSFFLNSIHVFVRAPGEPFYVHEDGSVLRIRTEGWADSHVGRWGVNGIADAGRIKTAKVAFWGDSFVEAAGVSDAEKMAQVFTAISTQYFPATVTAVAMANSGNSCADYYGQMPFYQRALGPFAAHVVVLGAIEDTFPDQASAHGAQFVSQPEFRFIPEQRQYSFLALRPLLAGLRLEFLWNLITDGRALRLEFRPGPHGAGAPEGGAAAAGAAYDRSAAWQFLLRNLRARAQAPLVFVYLPEVPMIKKSKAMTQDPNRQAAAEFAAACKAEGVGFVNLEPDFIRYWKQTGRFPRGFANSHPWEGHLNRAGHRLVAEAVARYMRENGFAIHAD